MSATRFVSGLVCCLVFSDIVLALDVLPSWNDGPSKSAIIDFVGKITKEGSPDFVPEAERIATFDNDGTLWCEQPMYFQGLFAFDRIRAMAKDHPEWRDKEPFKSVIDGDMKTLGEQGRKGTVGDCSRDSFRHDG